MNVKDRQFVERAIARQVLTSLINEGFFVTIYDGEEFVEPFFSKDVEALLKAMFSTDEEHINVYRTEGGDLEEYDGYVFLVYGNDGTDVISDYTVNLDSVLQPAEQLADAFEKEGIAAVARRLD